MKKPGQDEQIIKYFIILLISKPETRRGYGGFYVKFFRWSLAVKEKYWDRSRYRCAIYPETIWQVSEL